MPRIQPGIGACRSEGAWEREGSSEGFILVAPLVKSSPSEVTVSRQQGPSPDRSGVPASTLCWGLVRHPFPMLVLQLSDQKAMDVAGKLMKPFLSEDSIYAS